MEENQNKPEAIRSSDMATNMAFHEKEMSKQLKERCLSLSVSLYTRDHDEEGIIERATKFYEFITK